jgi:hypothetical protein
VEGSLDLAQGRLAGADRAGAERAARLELGGDGLAATGVTETQERRSLLEELLGEVGEDVEIKPPFQCDYGYPISVGARTFINYGAVILDVAPGDDRDGRADRDGSAPAGNRPSRSPWKTASGWAAGRSSARE